MLRTMELLLGLPPMSQYDAAAMPMYAAFGAEPDANPVNHLPPLVDLNAKNIAQPMERRLPRKWTSMMSIGTHRFC